jgi:hypothetical protein
MQVAIQVDEALEKQGEDEQHVVQGIITAYVLPAL